MSLNDFVLNPPFNVTRTSHVVLNVSDLEASKHFYTELVGLVVSDEDANSVYLRGLEENGHHSLVLSKSPDAGKCARIGMRVLTDDDIHAAQDYFGSRGIDCQLVDVPFQGPTLHVTDSTGVPLELTSSMERRPRMMKEYNHYRGASAQRIDHYQIQTHDVRRAYEFYQPLGFRLSEYTFSKREDGGENLWGVWMQRKGNPHDIVFTNGLGPRLHHFAYTLPDTNDMIRACDVAGSLGYAARLERGPGRHGISGALFVYFRDPDGHRVELFNTHYQHIDLEPPLAWDLADPKRADQWGFPAQKKWFAEASPFVGTEPREPNIKVDPPTLERFLAMVNE
ncbi:3,4-dihydroxyphenylacetate 2,3-dioxygenase [Marinobacter sp. JSM 1782161]|uniref:3,4-dihydroxyphenylacetate 2,3-dioxygenase n=1 Tax=Marinobacter sp. JSM 1782161 TaxID=2685906 RepID=UPI0014032E9F|nr:3,4-dihydroxyphenylacetate 2,3-dioxygenase [Marinobacter sp. JSM 1782161]